MGKLTVQTHGIHLSKLMYLSKDEFKKMRGLLRSFLGRARRSFKVAPKKEAINSRKRRYDKVTQERTNGMWHYEPTNIISTLELRSGNEDLRRRWARVREYTNEVFDEDSKDLRRMIKGIMNGHLIL